MNVIEIIGWVGAVSLLFAYYLIQTDKVIADNKIYIALNIVGSLFLLINTYHHGAYPSMTANFIWLMVGLFTVCRMFLA